LHLTVNNREIKMIHINRSTVYGINPKIPHINNRPKCNAEGCTKHVMIIRASPKTGEPTYRKWCSLHHASRTSEKRGVKNVQELWANNLGFTGPDAVKKAKAHVIKEKGCHSWTEYALQTKLENLKAEKAAREAGFDSANAHRFYLQEQLAKEKGFATYLEYQQDTQAKEKGFSTYSEYVYAQAEKLAFAAGFASVTDWKNSTHEYRYARKDYCENIDGRLEFTCQTVMPGGFKAHLEVDHINGDPTDNRPENLQTLCSCCHKYKTLKFGDSKTIGRTKLKRIAKQAESVTAL
jgi:hypothetical protein